jgi:F-type H+-transporting ATPase subunit gamma
LSETLQGTGRRIKSAEGLHAVVRTMKALAAVNIRQYEESVRSLRDYSRSVESGIHAALLNRPLVESASGARESLAIVFGSDQGMVGQFNEAIVDFAGDSLDKEGAAGGSATALWVVGVRTLGSAEERFGTIEESFALPSSSRTVTGAVSDIILRFEERRRRRGETRLVVFHNTPRTGASYGQRRLVLYPLDGKWLREKALGKWPRRGLPSYSLAWERLFSSLIGEHIFVSLYQAFSASMAAENAARLASMQRAEKNIEEMLEELVKQYNALRQMLITEELFDVVSGFEALTAKAF